MATQDSRRVEAMQVLHGSATLQQNLRPSAFETPGKPQHLRWVTAQVPQVPQVLHQISRPHTGAMSHPACPYACSRQEGPAAIGWSRRHTLASALRATRIRTARPGGGHVQTRARVCRASRGVDQIGGRVIRSRRARSLKAYSPPSRISQTDLRMSGFSNPPL